MKLIAFDLETTGADPATARIVTYSAIHLGADGEIGQAYNGLVNPGIAIPDEAAAVHGVTTEKAAAEGMSPTKALSQLAWALNRGIPVCAFNARYDLTVLAHELRRYGMPFEWINELHVIDPLVIDKQVDKYRRGKRQLGVVCAHYGITLDNAHAADADALAAGQLFHAQLKVHAKALNLGGARGLHAAQVHWAREQAESLQAYFRRTNPEAFVEPRWPYYLTEEEAPA